MPPIGKGKNVSVRKKRLKKRGAGVLWEREENKKQGGVVKQRR